MAVTSESSTTDLHIYAAYMGKKDMRVTMVAQIKCKGQTFQAHFTIANKIILIIILLLLLVINFTQRVKQSLYGPGEALRVPGR